MLHLPTEGGHLKNHTTPLGTRQRGGLAAGDPRSNNAAGAVDRMFPPADAGLALRRRIAVASRRLAGLQHVAAMLNATTGRATGPVFR